MFDDQKQPQNNPTSVPEDMFSVDDKGGPISGVSPFSSASIDAGQKESPSAGAGPVIRTMAQDREGLAMGGNAATKATVIDAAGAEADPWSKLDPKERAALESIQSGVGNRLIKIFVWVVIIVILAGGVYAAVRWVDWSALKGVLIKEEVVISDNASEVAAEANDYLEAAVKKTDNNSIPAPVDDDADRDGLSDEEEAELGTNINEPDSDSDGLSDQAEVKTYKTDPMKSDSDGDGYPDGFEIRNGSDPLDPKPDASLFKVDVSHLEQAIPSN